MVPRDRLQTLEAKKVRKPKPNIKSEWFIKQQVREILTDTGWTFWMPSADIYGRNGVSDFLAIKQPGLFMAIETKYKDVVTALQCKFLTDVYEAGHHAFVVDETNVDELQELLAGELNPYQVETTLEKLLKWRDQVAEKLDV
jgi:hypothetical protein